MGEVFFTPRAIKANEDAVRKSFECPPDDTAENRCRSRMGQRLGPAYIRAILDEINRGTPLEVYAPTLLSMLGWMLANSVASIPDLEERGRQLARYMILVKAEAINYSAGNEIAEPGADAYGEEVAGHG